MTYGWWRRLSLVVLLILLATGPVVLVSQAAGSRLNGAHWARKSTPFTLKVGDNVGGGWNSYLNQAVRDWNKVGVVKMQVVQGRAGNPKNCPITEGRVEVCSANYGNNGWLGLSQIELTANDKHITGAAVLMNDHYFRRGKYDDKTAKLHTMCHELGHTLGLDHAKYPSCMNHSNKSVFDDAKPATKDKRILRRIYNHRDNNVTVSDAAVNSGFFDPAALPELPSDAELSTTAETITEPLGNGRILVTTITWVKDGKR